MKKQKLVTIISKLKSQLLPSDETLKIKTWLVFVLLLGVTALLINLKGDKKKLPTEAPDESMDTFIPPGESLVPIKVANFESLDQIMGQYGVVDLYTTPLNPLEKPKRVGFAVKLIRSSLKPDHFSVLVPVDKVAQLVSYSGEYTVSVRNPKSQGTHFAQEKKKKGRRSIRFEDNPS